MRSITKTDLNIGNIDISVSFFKAVDNETGFKLMSKCCNSAVIYKRFCSSCGRELSYNEVYKSLEGTEINTEDLKEEKGNLKIIGVIPKEFIFYRNIYYILPYEETHRSKKPNLDRLKRTIEKFSYLRDALIESNKLLIGKVVLRDKLKYIALIPYELGFLGVELIYTEQIREMKEALPTIIYEELKNFKTDNKITTKMAEKIKNKNNINLKEIKNAREQKIKEMVLKPLKKVKKRKPKPQELIKALGF